MDIGRQVLKINETLFEGFGEHTVECEVIIPDYCPEVYKVVRAEAVPRVRNRRVEGDKLVIQGMIEFRVVYLPEDGKTLRCFICCEDFEHSFVIGAAGSVNSIRVRTKVEYVGCKLMNPRKAYLKAVLGIAAKTWTEREIEIVKYAETEETHMQKKDTAVFNLIGTGEKSFRIAEDLDLYKGEATNGVIIKNDVSVFYEDAKIISNKIIAKGSAAVRTLYSRDGSSEITVSEHSIPFSQIIDLDGVDETCECEVRFEVTDVKTMLKDNITGSSCVMQTEVGCVAYARAFRNEWATIVKDAFDTVYDINLESKSVVLERYIDRIKGVSTVKDTISTSDTLESVLDIMAIPVVSGVSFDGKSVSVSGTIETMLLCTNSDGDIINIEKSVPYTYTAAIKELCEHIRCEPEAAVVSAGYVIASDNSVDLRIQLDVEAFVYGSATETVVTNITEGAEKNRDKANLPVLTLYFASKDEMVWDIAKRFDTNPYAIRIANKISEDELITEGQMVVLPRKRRIKK